MPANFRRVPVEFNFGPDGADARASRGMLKVENAQWNHEGAVTKRYGFNRTNTTNQQRTLLDIGGKVFSASPGLTNNSSEPLATVDDGGLVVCNLDAKNSSTVNVSTNSGPITCALLSGDIVAIGYQSGGYHYLDFFDRVTGEIIATKQVTGSTYPMVICSITSDRIYGNIGVSSYFRYSLSDLQAGNSVSVSTYTTIGPSANAPEPLDVAVVGTYVCVVYNDTANDYPTITFFPNYGDNASKATHTIVAAAWATDISVIELNTSTPTALVTYTLGTGDVAVQEIDQAGSATSKTVSNGTGYTNATGLCAVRTSDSEAYIIFSQETTDSTNFKASQTSLPSTKISPWSSISVSTLIPNAVPASKPWLLDDGTYSTASDKVHLWCVHKNETASGQDDEITSILVNGQGNVIAYCGLASTRHYQQFAREVITADSGATVYYYPMTMSKGYLRATASLSPFGPVGRTEAISPAAIAGGCPRVVDRRQGMPFPFLNNGPGKIVIDENNTTPGNGSLATGSYDFVCTWYWQDSEGNEYESPPSTPVSLASYAGSGTEGISAWVPICPVVGVATRVYWKQSSETLYYRLDQASSGSATLYTSQGNEGAGSYLITDFDKSLSDATSTVVLYTQTGEQGGVAPPPCSTIVQHGNRLICNSTEEPETELWYSKERTDGYGYQFTFDNVLKCTAVGGEVVALRSYLDKLWILKERAILFSEGDGYDNYGGGQNYESPILLNTSIGCATAASVVDAGQGFAWFSGDIIYRVSGGLQVEPIGEAVRYWTSGNSVVASYSDQAQHRCVWVMDTGTAVVFDWKFNRWSTFTGTLFTKCVDALNVGGTPYLLSGRGTGGVGSYAYQNLYNRGTSNIQDQLLTGSGATGTTDTENFVMALDTGWIQMAEYQRVYGFEVHGYTTDTNFDLYVREAYNFDKTWISSKTKTVQLDSVTEADYHGQSNNDSFNDRAMTLYSPLSRTHCNAVRIQIGDTDASANAATGLSLVKLVFDAKEIPARQRRQSGREV